MVDLLSRLKAGEEVNLMPSALALIRHLFTDPRERSPAVGLREATAPVGAAVGPVLGGFLLEHYWWGSGAA